jgi:hypothetical protein
MEIIWTCSERGHATDKGTCRIVDLVGCGIEEVLPRRTGVVLPLEGEVALLLRNSQRPGLQINLRNFSPIADREQSVVRETVRLTIRSSPATPKPNEFSNITREIVANREIVATVGEGE